MNVLTRLIHVLVLLAGLMLAGGAAAQSAVSVDPAAKLFVGRPGQTITQEVRITNPGSKGTVFNVSAYLLDLDHDGTGQVNYPAAGTLRESAARWLTVSPTQFRMDGQESRLLRYTVQIPADATPGTHWVTLMFEAQDSAPVVGKVIASMRVRVSHTIFVNVEPTRNSGVISGIFDKLPKNENDSYEIAVQYENNGNTAVGLRGRIELRDERGNLAVTLPVDLRVSLPGRNLMLTQGMVGPFKKGRYTALVILNDGDKTRDVVGEHSFELPFDLAAPKAAAPAPAGATSSQTAQQTPGSAAPAPAGSGGPR